MPAPVTEAEAVFMKLRRERPDFGILYFIGVSPTWTRIA